MLSVTRCTALRWLRPASIEEACELLAAEGPHARPAAGCTLISPHALRDDPDVHVAVDLAGIAELREIRVEHGELVIGAMTSVAAVASDERVRRSWGLLAAACGTIADDVVRQAATVGGNLAARVPGPFDVAVAAVVFDARVVLATAAGSREVPVERFADPSFVLRQDDLLVAARFAPGHSAWHYARETTNASHPVVALAVQLTPSGPRAAAAVGLHHPVRLSMLDDVVVTEWPQEDVAAVAKDLSANVPAADDAIASATYRRRLLSVLVEDAIRDIGKQEWPKTR